MQVFGAEVAATAPACFDGCGDQKTNTSSPCWVNCFYQAALGAEVRQPNHTPPACWILMGLRPPVLCVEASSALLPHGGGGGGGDHARKTKQTA